MYPYLTSAWSWVFGAKFWLAAVLVTGLAAYGAGWYGGSTHEARIMADAATRAAQAAQAMQAAKDADDWQTTRLDFEKRLAAKQKGLIVYQTIYKDRLMLVPHQEACKDKAPSMGRLNDPDLIGGDAQ